MKHLILRAALLGLLALPLAASAQSDGFVIRGRLNMPDGTTVGILANTPTEYSKELDQTVVKDGTFELRGKIGQPMPATLITNNLDLTEKNAWPSDSIRWTYTNLFLADTIYSVTPDLNIVGGEVQRDYVAYMPTENARPDDWAFIAARPRSVVSVWLANKLLERAYNLTNEQVATIKATIQPNPLDPARYEELTRRLADGSLTTIGSPLLDFPIVDVNDQETTAVAALPRTPYVLIDFWASWCGICLYQMPEVAKIADEYKEQLGIISISIDEKPEAWRNGMAKHPEPWPQYRTTKAGYDVIFTRYQLGAGVPYYLLLDADGNVVASPSGPDEVRTLMQHLGK